MKLAAAIFSFFILPLAEAGEIVPPALESAVKQSAPTASNRGWK